MAILFWVWKTLTNAKQTHASYLELTHRGRGESEIKQMSDGSGGGNARKTHRAGEGWRERREMYVNFLYSHHISSVPDRGQGCRGRSQEPQGGRWTEWGEGRVVGTEVQEAAEKTLALEHPE